MNIAVTATRYGCLLTAHFAVWGAGQGRIDDNMMLSQSGLARSHFLRAQVALANLLQLPLSDPTVYSYSIDTS